MSQQWKVGLFDCFGDISTCLIGWVCPCYLFGQNAEQIDGSNKIQMCVAYACLSGCYASCILQKPRREQLRRAYNIHEQPSDFLATFCCGPCANCQEARELKGHGVQPGGRMPISNQPR